TRSSQPAASTSPPGSFSRRRNPTTASASTSSARPTSSTCTDLLGAGALLGGGAGAVDSGVVGAQIGLDHLGVLEHVLGRALGDDRAELEGDHAVADGRQQRHVVLDDQDRAAGAVA